MDAVAVAMVEALPATAPTLGWFTIGSLPAGLSTAAVSTDGSRIYTSYGIMASDSTTNGYVIDVSTGAVSTLPVAPGQAAYAAGGAFCNGKHYAIGGVTSSNSALSNVRAYAPAGIDGSTGVWTELVAMPSAACYQATAAIGGFIYAAGGQNINSSTNNARRTLIRYDTTANTWTSLANMPAERTRGAMVAVGSKLYYFGGLNASGIAQSTVYVFDTTAGTWTTGASLTSALSKMAAAVVGSFVYLTTGSTAITYNTPDGDTMTVASTTSTAHGDSPGLVNANGSLCYVSGSNTANVDKLDLGAGTGYTAAVLGAKSLLNPLLAGVASILPATPPTDTAGKAAYAQTVQTLKALAAL